MAKKVQRTYQQDIVGDGISSIQKVREPHRERSGKGIKYVLIGVCTLFLSVMLLLPLTVVVTNALRDGWEAYREAVFDEYTIKALQLTLLAAVTAELIPYLVFLHLTCYRSIISGGAGSLPHS